jgi:hypothetical protein
MRLILKMCEIIEVQMLTLTTSWYALSINKEFKEEKE